MCNNNLEEIDHLLDKGITFRMLPITGQQVQLLDTILKHDTIFISLLENAVGNVFLKVYEFSTNQG